MSGFQVGDKVFVAPDAKSTVNGVPYNTISTIRGKIAYVCTGQDNEGDYALSTDPNPELGSRGYAKGLYLSRVTDEDTDENTDQDTDKPKQAGWLAYFDSDDSVLFEQEIDALRHAVANKGRVKKVYYGVAFTNYYTGEDEA